MHSPRTFKVGMEQIGLLFLGLGILKFQAYALAVDENGPLVNKLLSCAIEILITAQGVRRQEKLDSFVSLR